MYKVILHNSNSVFLSCNTVPSQVNGYDCGLFVCCYAVGLHNMRDEIFTYADIYCSNSPLLEKVTLNSNFQFDQEVVTSFREQLGTLVENLSSVYHFGKVRKGGTGQQRSPRKGKVKTTKRKFTKKSSEALNQSGTKTAIEEDLKPTSRSKSNKALNQSGTKTPMEEDAKPKSRVLLLPDNLNKTKFHEFYLPEGLFNNNFSLGSPQKCKFAGVVYTPPLHQLKYEALGVEVNLKRGNTAGVGRINEKVHIVTLKTNNLQYL
jgi:hypothetical protein